MNRIDWVKRERDSVRGLKGLKKDERNSTAGWTGRSEETSLCSFFLFVVVSDIC